MSEFQREVLSPFFVLLPSKPVRERSQVLGCSACLVCASPSCPVCAQACVTALGRGHGGGHPDTWLWPQHCSSGKAVSEGHTEGSTARLSQRCPCGPVIGNCTPLGARVCSCDVSSLGASCQELADALLFFLGGGRARKG